MHGQRQQYKHTGMWCAWAQLSNHGEKNRKRNPVKTLSRVAIVPLDILHATPADAHGIASAPNPAGSRPAAIAITQSLSPGGLSPLSPAPTMSAMGLSPCLVLPPGGMAGLPGYAAYRGPLRMEVAGDGFLYKMVRHLVGALLAVGQGKLSLEALRARIEAGAAAGAAGLARGGVRTHACIQPWASSLAHALSCRTTGRETFGGPLARPCRNRVAIRHACGVRLQASAVNGAATTWRPRTAYACTTSSTHPTWTTRPACCTLSCRMTRGAASPQAGTSFRVTMNDYGKFKDGHADQTQPLPCTACYRGTWDDMALGMPVQCCHRPARWSHSFSCTTACVLHHGLQCVLLLVFAPCKH